MYYCEFAETKYSRHGTMLPVEQALSVGVGYCSLFWFKKCDALVIRDRGSSKNLKEFAVYAEWLWIDIDDEDPVKAKQRFDEIVEKLRKYPILGYLSGKKGYHLGVKIQPMYGRHVPYSHKRWLNENEIECDESLYQHGRLFRNIGASHEETKRPKQLVLEDLSGDPLLIPTVIEQVKYEAIVTEDWSDSDQFRESLLRTIQTIEQPPKQGMRHTTFWSIASNLHDCGASFELAYELLCYVNRTLTHPKEEEEVERAIRDAYGKAQTLASPPSG